ncbi:MAG: hypothetical protein OEW17_08545, partial [Gemmatimonadota bacterium]|nr:hypothetical protein [Gemmatimonadota bacterium]
PVPEGMSAESALRHEVFVTRQRALADQVGRIAIGYEREKGYPPPYWVLVDLARQAAASPAGPAR